MIGNPYIIIQPAGIAQLVEQLLRKQLVGGSSPLSGTNNLLIFIVKVSITFKNWSSKSASATLVQPSAPCVYSSPAQCLSGS